MALAASTCDAVADFAREIAVSASASAEMALSAVAARSRDALAAEGMDMLRSEGAATGALRGALLAAAREAVRALPVAALRPGPEPMLGENEAAVKVEVRSNAGRVVRGAFTIGSSHGCDVQVGGDPTVEPTQLLVIPLCGGAIVVDAFSESGSRVVARGREGRAPAPILGPVCDAALVLEQGESVEVEIGDRTTVTIAPQALPTPVCGPSGADPAPCLRKRGSSASTGLGLSRMGSLCHVSPSRSPERSRSPARRLSRRRACEEVAAC